MGKHSLGIPSPHSLRQFARETMGFTQKEKGGFENSARRHRRGGRSEVHRESVAGWAGFSLGVLIASCTAKLNVH